MIGADQPLHEKNIVCQSVKICGFATKPPLFVDNFRFQPTPSTKPPLFVDNLRFQPTPSTKEPLFVDEGCREELGNLGKAEWREKREKRESAGGVSVADKFL